MIKYLSGLLIALEIAISSLEPTQEVMNLYTQINENQHLSEYLEAFPFNNYKIATIADLGSFYIDDIPDGIKWHLSQGIYWERTIGNLIQEYTVPGSVVLDLGAHIGIHSLTMSKKTGPNGLVISFEPQYKIFRELSQNMKLNNCNNVIALRYAVGDVEKSITMLKANPHNEGGTAVKEGKFESWQSGDVAPMITIDSLKLNNVSLIKMDVESYELKVLQGAEKTILRNKPVIIFEILGGVNLDTCEGQDLKDYHAIISFLESLDYFINRIEGNDFIAFPVSL